MVDSFSIHELPKPRPLLRFTVTACHQPVRTNSISSGEKKTLRKVCSRRNHRFIGFLGSGLVRRKVIQQTQRSHCISRSEFEDRCQYLVLSLATSVSGGRLDQRYLRNYIRSPLNRSKPSRPTP